MKLEELLDFFWNDYISITPIAKSIHQLLEERGETIYNDHVAFRTLAVPGIGLEAFSSFFKEFGYEVKGQYDFEIKKLNAIHLENIENPKMPKIFISELRYRELSDSSVSLIEREISKIRGISLADLISKKDVFNISSSEYESLLKESEYAAWLCALGFRANHFTVLVNELKSFKNLEELNALLQRNHVPLNTSGGLIKGSPNVYLEQSSTMASRVKVNFSDKELLVPTCYYEFALRYSMSNGELYQGFVTDSADKIFESTNHELDK